MRTKIVGKNIVSKSSKTRFLYSHEYRHKKWGEKRAIQILQKHSNSAKKMLGKNRLKKVRK